MSIRIVIADDHPVILAGVREALGEVPDIDVVAGVEDSTALVEALGRFPVDVAVTDYSMPGGQYGDGVALVGFLRRRFSAVPLVVLTSVGGAQVLASIRRAGVSCIVSKSDPIPELAEAIRAAKEGRPYLSPEIERQLGSATIEQAVLTRREAEVVRLIAEGKTQKEIAQQLQRSRQTISTQKHSAMRKLGLQRSAEIFEYALNEGMVSASQGARLARGPRRNDDD
ncbi:response regulator transcription factor [Stenotrophomonas maltophilia]|uniref:response regulator transcription factor n=1 Tax=Stenotrophomonas maltophilia group TaxID=995085 RepID=UPI0006AC50B2|nr:response regulator transcription factor [Stenotrophomonas maltophilia]KOQ61804.1 LuxR family transcriptional regulator [Stenotrophomonas maltophilia]MBN7829363.1 response regulator transcription factor [Stenotrophomonas maltophilia]MBN7832617.1 response regulator transcription factor [Stenotrophomonas maltophilia]MBN7858309.1 response regulator transcription factor [Stenotrophomonas maltophilia]MBN7916547.1 response regulator transcription factor [Stenotrophomonas maltophilia]